jgi:hypothetical protein
MFGTGLLIYHSYNIYTKHNHLNLELIYNYLIIGPLLIIEAFFCFWLPEQLFCGMYNVEERSYYIQKTPLHALWHLFSSFGILLWIIALMDFNRIRDRYKKYDNFRISPLQNV